MSRNVIFGIAVPALQNANGDIWRAPRTAVNVKIKLLSTMHMLVWLVSSCQSKGNLNLRSHKQGSWEFLSVSSRTERPFLPAVFGMFLISISEFAFYKIILEHYFDSPLVSLKVWTTAHTNTKNLSPHGLVEVGWVSLQKTSHQHV